MPAKKKQRYNVKNLRSHKIGILKTEKFRRNKHETWEEHHKKLYAIYFPRLSVSPIQNPNETTFEVWHREHSTSKLCKIVDNTTILTLFRWKLPQKDCLWIDTMMNNLKLSKKCNDHLGMDRRALVNGVSHHGWHLYGNTARLWNSTNRQFVEKLRPLIYEVSSLAKNGLPHKYELAMTIDKERRIGNSAFTGLASNWYDPVLPGFPNHSALHVDGNDILCLIVATGHWPANQGYLGFPQLKLLVDLRPGDIIVFDSSLLYHMVTEISSGYRNALIFFSHKALLKKPNTTEPNDWINQI